MNIIRFFRREVKGIIRFFRIVIMDIIRFFRIFILIYRYGENLLRDPLTDAFNKVPLEEFGKLEIRRADRYGSSLCGLMFDVDGLKQINDGKGGHDAGDIALRTVVNVFRKICRASDIIFRVGGDEFFVLLPGASKSGMKQLLERIREELKNFSLSISIGTCFWKKDMTLDELKKKADISLYKNKNLKKKKPG